MKKTGYVDYRKASEYFSDKEEFLSQDIEAVEKQKKFITWVQEFSKKIVVVIFIMYIFSSISSLFLVYLSFTQGLISGIDTFISETNQTFREVVGGYIIKSAVENAVKIAGNYYIGICDAKLKAAKAALKKNGVEGLEDNSNNNNNSEENDYGYNEDFPIA